MHRPIDPADSGEQLKPVGVVDDPVGGEAVSHRREACAGRQDHACTLSGATAGGQGGDGGQGGEDAFHFSA